MLGVHTPDTICTAISIERISVTLQLQSCHRAKDGTSGLQHVHWAQASTDALLLVR